MEVGLMYTFRKEPWWNRFQFRKHNTRSETKSVVPFDDQSIFVPKYARLDAPNAIKPLTNVHKNIYIDESGSAGHKSPKKKFVMGALVAEDDMIIEKVTGNFPRSPNITYTLQDGTIIKPKMEYKYSLAHDRMPQDCDKTMRDLSNAQLDYYVKVLETDLSDPRDAKTVYMDTLRSLVDDIVHYDNTAEFDIYLDKGNLERSDIQEALQGIQGVKFRIHDPYAIDGMPGLRAVDFIASSSGYYYNNDKDTDARRHYGMIKKKIVNKNKKSVSGLKPRSISLPPARSHETCYTYPWGYLIISSKYDWS